MRRKTGYHSFSRHLNRSGYTITEITGFLGAVGVLVLLVLQLQMVGVLTKQNHEGFQEVKRIVDARFSKSFAFGRNDCPIPELARDMRLYQLNLEPEADQVKFPVLDSYYSKTVDLVGLQYVELPLERSPGKRSLASAGDLVEGDHYTVQSAAGAFQVQLRTLKVFPTPEEGVFVVRSQWTRDKDQQGLGRSVQVVDFPVRAMKNGSETFCWGLNNVAAEKCFAKGGIPAGSNGECVRSSERAL